MRADIVVLAPACGPRCRRRAGVVRAAARRRAFLHRHRADPRACRASLPVLRDADDCSYFKEDAGKLLVGWFEPRAKPWGTERHPGGFLLRPVARGPRAHRAVARPRHAPRADRWSTPACRCSSTGRRVSPPTIATCSARRRRCAACSSRPASTPSASSRRAAPGKVLADWIVDGHPPWTCGTSTSAAACRSSATGATCATAPSSRSGCCMRCTGRSARAETARGVRASVLHDRLAAAGAASARSPAWSAPTGSPPTVQPPRYEYSYGRQNWFAQSARRAPRGARAGRPVRPVLVRQVRAQGTRCARACSNRIVRRRRRRADRPRRLHAVAERARRHRGGPHRHARGAGRLPDRHAARDADARLSWLTCSVRQPRRRLRGRRVLGLRRARPHGAARARAAATLTARTTSPTPRSRSRRSRDRCSATRACARAASPMSASSAGSCTFRPNSPNHVFDRDRRRPAQRSGCGSPATTR